MRQVIQLLVSAVLTLSALPATAQLLDALFASKLDVSVDHAPLLPLKLSTVALADPEGQCSESVLGRIEADFVQNGVKVVDRQHLNQVLREYKLQVNGLFDAKTAANVGQLVGAQALVFLKILQCDADRRTEQLTQTNLITNQSRVVTKYITAGHIRGSLRTVDLTTGLVLAAQSLEQSSIAEQFDGFPPNATPLGIAEQEVARYVHRVFFPWNEMRSVVYYQDKECNLKDSFQLLRARDLEGAQHEAEKGLAVCLEKNANGRAKAHAYYNLGLVNFLRGSFSAANSNLTESVKLQGGDGAVKLLDESRKAEKQMTASASPAPDPQAAVAASRQVSAVVDPASAAGRGTPPALLGGTGVGGKSVEDRLQQLDGLKKRGLITSEEYAKKRADIIGGI